MFWEISSMLSILHVVWLDACPFCQGKSVLNLSLFRWGSSWYSNHGCRPKISRFPWTGRSNDHRSSVSWFLLLRFWFRCFSLFNLINVFHFFHFFDFFIFLLSRFVIKVCYQGRQGRSKKLRSLIRDEAKGKAKSNRRFRVCESNFSSGHLFFITKTKRKKAKKARPWGQARQGQAREAVQLLVGEVRNVISCLMVVVLALDLMPKCNFDAVQSDRRKMNETWPTQSRGNHINQLYEGEFFSFTST